jgi:iron complex transport system ATP-binding protein
MTATLALDGVSVAYAGVPALRAITLAVAPRQVIGLIGPNGSGKSTLLKAALGLVPLEAGGVTLAGRPLAAWKPVQRARRIGYLPQDRTVVWPVSVERLIALGRLPHLAPWQHPQPADVAAVARAMAETDVGHLRDRAVTSLSGGERARVLLARLLAGAPDILLADEPTAGLDPAHSLQVMAVFQRTAAAGRAVVVVLHDLTAAARFCDRLVLLDGGRVVADGLPANVLTPETLARHYHVRAAVASVDGEALILPWSV